MTSKQLSFYAVRFLITGMKQKIITIVGGTGFLGRYIVRRLAKAGYTLRIVTRHPELALHLKTAGDVGQIVLMSGNLAKPESLVGKLDHSYAVINLVGVLYESGSQKFITLHARGAEKLAQMAKAAKVERFIHISALGVDKAIESHYARSKVLGEKTVLAGFPEATILRPGIIFGAEDNFFNQFARLASLLPALPVIGGGNTRFQPVYVDDVARAVEICLSRGDVKGHIYELGGLQTYTFRELLQYVLDITEKKCSLLGVPFGLASLIGAVSELLPKPMLTRDQVTLLKYDNVVSPNARTFANLGIAPLSLDMVVPEYLARFHRQQAAA